MANEKRLIDANALMDDVEMDGALHACLGDADDVRFLVDSQPTVDAVEVVHGHWINNGGLRKMDLYCSVCNRRASNFVGGYEDWWDLWMPKYCPNCGAKMDGDGNDAK